jgi:tRNA (mo5U34)-methyltransferase
MSRITPMSTTTAVDAEAARRAIKDNPVWYHTLELGPGLTTPGWFDLRGIVDKLPWPDVAGKRCLDVATYDGFFAFELERRGAAEVVCTDIPDHANWDWPPHSRAKGPAALASFAGEKGRGFDVAHGILGSKVRKIIRSVYDLDPEADGRFDIVVCGSLMLHLRDPLRALEAIRGVCDGVFLSMEEIRLSSTLLHPKRPVADLDGIRDLCQWWVPNVAGHRRMVQSAGFEILETTRPYAEAFGPAHPRRRLRPYEQAEALLRRVTLKGDGVPHAALLARPAV